MYDIETDFYHRCVPMSEEVSLALDSTKFVHGMTSKGIAYKMDSTSRKSGDQTTSVGNSVVNGLALLYVVHCATGWSALEMENQPLRVTVLGDDGYIVCKKELADKMVEMGVMADLGFKAKSRSIHTYEAEFCSSCFVPSDSGSILTVKPGRVFSRLFWCKKNYTGRKRLRWMKGIAISFNQDFGHIPVLRTLFKKVLELTADVKASDAITLTGWHWHAENKAAVADSTWEWFYDRYSLNKSELEDCERMISSVQNLNVLLTHKVLRRFHEVDVGSLPGSI